MSVKRPLTIIEFEGKHLGAVQGFHDKHEAIIILSSQVLRFGDVDGANELLWNYKQLDISYETVIDKD